MGHCGLAEISKAQAPLVSRLPLPTPRLDFPPPRCTFDSEGLPGGKIEGVTVEACWGTRCPQGASERACRQGALWTQAHSPDWGKRGGSHVVRPPGCRPVATPGGSPACLCLAGRPSPRGGFPGSPILPGLRRRSSWGAHLAYGQGVHGNHRGRSSRNLASAPQCHADGRDNPSALLASLPCPEADTACRGGAWTTPRPERKPGPTGTGACPGPSLLEQGVTSTANRG